MNTVSNVASITDNDNALKLKDELTVYPNPVVNNVIVTIPAYFNKETVVLLLSNINGKVIRRVVAKDSRHTLDLSKVTPGTYFITVTNGIKKLTKKIIK